MIRQPIVSVLGHVDSGKTSLLDKIRESNMASKEAGGITQSIGSTEIPINTIQKLCSNLLEKWKINLKIPGLLFIDTPGHSAFISMRRRGGSLSDIAVLVIDINQGVQPQTKESIEILKLYKTPFIIALNKIDLIDGWKNSKECFLDNLKEQPQWVREKLEKKIYDIMGQLSIEKIYTDRYDRVSDFKKTFALVPVSSKTGEGVPDLIMLLAGLSQQFLKDELEVKEVNGKGAVLEVKETKGFGKTIDVILYEGVIKRGQNIAFLTKEGIKVSTIKSILRPNPLEDIRATKKFLQYKEVYPSNGIKVVAKDIDNIMAGSTIISFERGQEKVIKELKAEENPDVMLSKTGVVIKADSLGGIEALFKILEEEKISVKKAEIGEIGKIDIINAESEKDDEKVVLGFNVSQTEVASQFAKDRNIEIITSNILYEIINKYNEWKEKLKKEKIDKALESINRPCKFVILQDHIFRKSSPLVCGISILDGVLNVNSEIMNDIGEIIGKILSIQDKMESIKKAERGMELAVSIEGGILGKNVQKNEILFTNIIRKDYEIIKNYESYLSQSERNVLREIVEIKDKRDRRWKLK